MKKTNKKLENIALKSFVNIETLETRNRDDLDFHDVAVWSIKKALREAYELGLKEGKKHE